MTKSDAGAAEWVRAVAVEQRRELTGHPAPTQLLAYHRDQVAPEEMQEIRSHLALCPECARAVLDFGRFPKIEPADGTEPLTEEELDDAWADFKRRSPAAAPRSSPWPPLALAASLLLATSGLALWGVAWFRGHLQPTNLQATASLANPLVLQLLPREAAVVRGAPPEPVASGASSGPLVLLLSVSEPVAAPCTLKIFPEAGGPAHVQEGLLAGPEGAFSVLLERRKFPPGRYRLELWSAAPAGAGSSAPAAVYDLALVDPVPGP